MKGFIEKKVLANIWPEIEFENVSESIAIHSNPKLIILKQRDFKILSLSISKSSH